MIEWTAAIDDGNPHVVFDSDDVPMCICGGETMIVKSAIRPDQPSRLSVFCGRCKSFLTDRILFTEIDAAALEKMIREEDDRNSNRSFRPPN